MAAGGTVLLGGRYRVLDTLGDGGMARVFRARDERLGRVVAVKILHQHYLAQPEFVRRFEQEARLAASLAHPNIVAIYDVDRQGDTYYIVMEYVEGGSLKGLIARDAPLPLSLAAAITRQLGQALDAAHANGVIHRDIKPENILLTPSYDVKVGDFGIARALTSVGQTATGMVMGSVSYFSPEQAQGKTATAESDLYSSGVVLYEMLTGRLPFAAGNPLATAMQHITQEPAPPRAIVPALPPAVDTVTLTALAKDPARRYHAGAALADALDAAVSTVTTRAGRAAAATGYTTASRAPSRGTKVQPAQPAPTIRTARASSTPRRRAVALPLALLLLFGGGAAYAVMHPSALRALFAGGAAGSGDGVATQPAGVGAATPGVAAPAANGGTASTAATESGAARGTAPPRDPSATVAPATGGKGRSLSPTGVAGGSSQGGVTADIITAMGYTRGVGGVLLPADARDTFAPGSTAYAVFHFHHFPPGAVVRALWTFPSGAHSSYILDRPAAYSWGLQNLGGAGRYTVAAIVNGAPAGSHTFSVTAGASPSTRAQPAAPAQSQGSQLASVGDSVKQDGYGKGHGAKAHDHGGNGPKSGD